MEKQKWKHSIPVCLVLLVHLSGFNCHLFQNVHPRLLVRSGSRESEINDYVYSLDYNRDKVLSYEGEKVKSIPTDGKLDGNKNFIVIKREKKNLSNERADVGVITTNEHRTYPGSILLANSRLIDNFPDIVTIERAPLKYTVNLPGLTDDGSFNIEPTFANYQAASNKVLKTWFEKYPDDNDTVALFQQESSIVYSKEQLRVQIGLEFKGTDVEENTDYSAVDKLEKLIMIHKFRQIFYTVSVESPIKPANLFGPNVTRSDLVGKFDSKNPPVLVDSVSYGRVIYVKIETSSTDQKAKDILENDLNKFNVEGDPKIDIDFSTLLNDFNMQVYVMGGGSQHIDLVNAKSIKDVNNVIVKYAKFGRDNLGYPIIYSSQFVKDNSRAVVNAMTEYTETTRTVYNSGTIKLSHTGAFVAQWDVEWDVLSYDQNGNEVLTHAKWYKSWQDLTASFEEEIPLKGNVRNIRVYARECTGLAWEWWREVIDCSGVPLDKYREFSIWGSTLYPAHSIKPPL